VKAVILAGGKGTRIAEESAARPKPLIEIGGRPILWHIMSGYAAHGITEFVICAGYKGYMLKEYFVNMLLHHADVEVDMVRREVSHLGANPPPWKVTVVDTGQETMTGGRLRRVAPFLTPGETFCMTYGDGVCDVDIADLLKFHSTRGKLATMTAVQPPGRFGSLNIHDQSVTSFLEKPIGDGGWINGGFFISFNSNDPKHSFARPQ
jgi:glucose-1-phosphate cytidylyltransferase